MPFTKTKLTLLIAIFLTLTGNITFCQQVLGTYPWHGNAAFLISLSLLLCAFIVFLLSFFSLVLPFRIVSGIFLILSANVAYFSDQFGTLFDTTMLQNIVETNLAEATELASAKLVLRVLLLGIVPAIWIWRLRITKVTWLHEFRYTLQTGVAALAVILLCVFSAGDQYASFIREHKALRAYANPVAPIYAIGKYISIAITAITPKTFKVLTESATLPEHDKNHALIIVVVGETARADHFSLNGYSRETNPKLATMDRLINFSQASSCGTSTATSVPCLFAFEGRADIDLAATKHTENILDVLAKAGVSVLWRDNNSGSKGVADRVPYENFHIPESNPLCDTECRDVGMLSGLQEYIDQQPGDMLIVLHQMGSHGPAYYKRYPPEFEKFKPSCHTSELSECSQQEIINAYDNSLRYTDYFLAEVIALLQDNTPQFATTMLYISDHGESLGENGIYLHGMPYLFAPAAQTHIPIILWLGSSSDIDYTRTLALQDQPISHDSFSHSLLRAFEVKVKFYQQSAPVAPLFVLKKEDDIP